MIPRSPDLLTAWRGLLVAALPDADVGPKRPADVTNRQTPFVRITTVGGPWRWNALWFPRLVAETWAVTVLEARDIDATVAQVTADMAGFIGPNFYITEAVLDSQGADATIDGSPVVITQASLCVQVDPTPEGA